jgi:hypothetical protein
VRIELEIESWGPRADETPRAFRIGGRRVAVTEVMDRWLGPDHRYIKLRGDDGAVYIVRHDEARRVWELTVWDRT